VKGPWLVSVRKSSGITGGELSVQLTRVAGIIFLARHLEPSDFGLYRMLLAICVLAILVNEAEMSEALIQRKALL
jgi:O-antigen/teichoic acid export membrane protein